MSDKPKRSVEEIQQEYARVCTRAGHTQYQLYTLQKDLELINNTLRDLNIEASSAPKVEEEKKDA